MRVCVCARPHVCVCVYRMAKEKEESVQNHRRYRYLKISIENLLLVGQRIIYANS